MPMSEPPWRITNLTLPLYFGCLTKALASFVASGATEVEPLIVIVAAEAAEAVASEALSASAMTTARGRLRVILGIRSSGRVRGKLRHPVSDRPSPSG